MAFTLLEIGVYGAFYGNENKPILEGLQRLYKG